MALGVLVFDVAHGTQDNRINKQDRHGSAARGFDTKGLGESTVE